MKIQIRLASVIILHVLITIAVGLNLRGSDCPKFRGIRACEGYTRGWPIVFQVDAQYVAYYAVPLDEPDGLCSKFTSLLGQNWHILECDLDIPSDGKVIHSLDELNRRITVKGFSGGRLAINVIVDLLLAFALTAGVSRFIFKHRAATISW